MSDIREITLRWSGHLQLAQYKETLNTETPQSWKPVKWRPWSTKRTCHDLLMYWWLICQVGTRLPDRLLWGEGSWSEKLLPADWPVGQSVSIPRGSASVLALTSWKMAYQLSDEINSSLSKLLLAMVFKTAMDKPEDTWLFYIFLFLTWRQRKSVPVLLNVVDPVLQIPQPFCWILPGIIYERSW